MKDFRKRYEWTQPPPKPNILTVIDYQCAPETRTYPKAHALASILSPFSSAVGVRPTPRFSSRDVAVVLTDKMASRIETVEHSHLNITKDTSERQKEDKPK